MLEKYSKHLSHYLPLLGVFIFGVVGFTVFSYDKTFQVFLAVLVSLGYVFWGIIHHKIHDDLQLFVVVEYVAIAALGLVIVYTLLIRA